MRKLLLIIFILGGLAPVVTIAQEEEPKFEPTFKWSGFTHMWATYAQRDSLDAHYGVNVRYLRFKASGKLTPKVSYGAQFGFDKGAAGLVDLYVKYDVADYFGLQAGRFAVPGIKSGVLTSSIWSSSKLIFNDRATITQQWASSNNGLLGYRRQGVMVYGAVMDKMIRYYVMAATASNSYFTANVKSSSYDYGLNGMSVHSRLEVVPVENIEVGVNFNTGSAVKTDTIEYTSMSYSAYALARQKTYYAFVEYVSGVGGGEFLNSGLEMADLEYNGFIAEVAYKFAGKYEPAVRYDTYVPDAEVDVTFSNLTFGFNFYPSSNIALMANYVMRMEEVGEFDNDMFYVQLRYKFKSSN